MSEDCLFCKIVAGDLPSVKVAEDETTYAFMDINPGTPGHLLVIPKRHSRDLLDVPPEDLSAMTLAAQRIARAAIDELDADGVNLLNCCGASAWQTVFHVHLHVVPRYEDARDHLELPWIPKPGDQDEIRGIGARLASALG